MAKLPKQVQAQADAAQEFDNQVRQANEPAPQDPPGAEDTPPNPAPPAPAPAPAPAPSQTPPDVDPEYWKQRFATVQGKYNAEVPLLRKQVSDLTESVQKLTKQLEQPVAKPPEKPSKLVTQQDVDAFGSDLVEMTRRVAREEFGEREQGYRDEIAQLKIELAAAKGEVGQVVENTAQQARSQFFKELDAGLPTWRQIQETQECQAFLGTRIPGRREVWNDALLEGANNLDVAAVLEVFGVLFEKHPALNPKKPAAPAPTPPSQNRELQRQVTPSRTTASAPPPQKRVFSARDYEQESMKQMRLMQAGKWEQAQALENELNQALAEGRVRG